ncbi:MAG: hypothetical protein ACE15E_10800 [Acidobacteriota bacterium]
MSDRDFARTCRIFRLGLLAAALVFAGGAFTLLLASPQSRAHSAQALFWHSFFPLDTGNRWVYAVQGPGSASRTWEVKVTERQAIPPFRTFFELSGYFSGKDPRLVRLSIMGRVLEIGDDGKEYLWYEFGGRVGRTWVMDLAPGNAPVCEDGALLRIGARDEVITVPAGQFKQVIRIDFMTKCSDAGITREWFAPGVGLIRREEASIAGPVVSELVYAEIAEKVFPTSAYTTALQLSSSHFVNNLMPPVDPSKLPRVRGAFVVRDRTAEPLELVFPTACRGLLLELRNEAGEVVLSINTIEGVACLAVITRVNVGKKPLVLPFSFALADKDGQPLPDGEYSLTAVLLTKAADSPLNPAARAVIQVTSIP